jgi:hypothetical protein
MALMPKLPPEELAKVIEWVCDNMNEMRLLFSSPLNLDFEAIAEMQPEPGFGEEEGEGEEGDDKSKGKPMKALSYTAADAVRANEAIEQLSAAVKRLPERRKFKPVMVR